MKLDHEAKMYAQRLKGSAYSPKFIAIHYLNIPRILMDFTLSDNVLSVDGLDLDGIHSFRGLGMIELHTILQTFRELIHTWNNYDKHGLNAFSLEDCRDMTEMDTGIRIHFDQPMRTKNCKKLLHVPYVTHGNIQTDPHIYCSVGKRKVCFCIDPLWITSNTAFGVFLSSTTSRIAGLGVIKQVTDENIIATPWVIGNIDMIDMDKILNTTAREITL